MLITRRMRRHSRTEDGQAVVEFALVIPVLLLLLLGIIQFGNVFRDYIALTDAVRVGARQASVGLSVPDVPPGNRETIIKNRVIKAAINLDGPPKMVITVEPVKIDGVTPGWEKSGDVTVRATYPFRLNLFGFVLFNGTLKSRTTERVE